MARRGIRLVVEFGGTRHLLVGEGNGPIDAAIHALRGAGIDVQVRSFEERRWRPARTAATPRPAPSSSSPRAGGQGGDRYGVGIDANIVTASIRAILSGSIACSGLRRAPAARAA